jgi:hypothetical protein
MAQPYQFATIECPDTGQLVTVRRTLDPIGRLFASNEINRIQVRVDLASLVRMLRLRPSGWRRYMVRQQSCAGDAS